MELGVDSFSDILGSLGMAMRKAVDGVVWSLGGQFMPANCRWCKPAWLIGLGMAAVLALFYWRGPRTD